ncbi:hypothetical protein VTI28DRAFT_9753 [Corynascus sepedonium]
MEDVSTQPVTSPPAPVQQPTPADQTSHSEIDAARLALNRFLITPRPVVRQLNPELATSAVEMASRVANVGSRAHFRNGSLDLGMARQRAQTVDIREEDLIDELDDPFGQTINADSKSNRIRGRSTRKNNDAIDDDEYKPRAPSGRKSGVRASSARKHARSGSPTVDQAPKKRRQGAAYGTMTSTRPGPGRPRKRALFSSPLQASPDSLTSAMPHIERCTNLMVTTVPSNPVDLQIEDPEQAAKFKPPVPEAWNQSKEMKASRDPITRTKRSRILATPSNIPSAGPAASTELGPQAKNSSSRKSFGDKNAENDAQADSKPAKQRMYKPKFEENGQSAKRARSRTVPEVDENGQPIKRPRGRPPASRSGTGSGPGQLGPRRGPPAFSCEGDRLLRSTEGEVMTRAQLEEAYPHDQRIYRSGGNLGGGKFEIIATGVVWSFVPENEQPIPRKELNHRSTKKSSKEGSKKVDASVNTPTATPADSAAHTQPGAEPRPPSSEKLTSRLVISPPIGKSKQTKLRIIRRNATTAQATPAALRAVTPGTATVSMTPSTASAPITSMAPSRSHRLRATPRAPRNTAHGSEFVPTAATPATDPHQRAARVRELDERCARYHVATRDRFDSDAAFLEHAESMLPLLYPDLNGPHGCGSGGSSGSPPPPPSREPSRSFI